VTSITASGSHLSTSDRLGVAAFGSLILHMVVILGVTFALPKLRPLEGLATLEITLVQSSTERAPDNPEFLAQANQDGGGDSDRPEIARNPLPVREVSDRSRVIPTARPKPQRRVTAKQERHDLMTQPRAEARIAAPEPEPEKKEPQTAPPETGLLASADSPERARLNAEISRFWEEYQKRPKRKFLNARTQEYKYAAYMDAWRAKVERIGNLNYPEEARLRRITGNLVLDVALNPDGSLHNVAIRRSSGHKLLDDAAIRIVELAAPFAPFPPDIRAEADLLHITRTWKFNETLLASD